MLYIQRLLGTFNLPKCSKVARNQNQFFWTGANQKPISLSLNIWILRHQNVRKIPKLSYRMCEMWIKAALVQVPMMTAHTQIMENNSREHTTSTLIILDIHTSTPHATKRLPVVWPTIPKKENHRDKQRPLVAIRTLTSGVLSAFASAVLETEWASLSVTVRLLVTASGTALALPVLRRPARHAAGPSTLPFTQRLGGLGTKPGTCSMFTCEACKEISRKLRDHLDTGNTSKQTLVV